jgi:mono/diheme cytochrome c family protein
MLGIAAVAGSVGVSLVLAAGAGLAADMKAKDPHARGRYVATIGGCNDCHTPGYAMSGGKVPEKQWFTGDQLGWNGPWGTTYPVNLRLYVQKLDEDAWVAKAKKLTARPPMPFWALNAMSESDLRALYRFVKGLGPAGEEAPAYLPPGQKPNGPYVAFPVPPQK